MVLGIILIASIIATIKISGYFSFVTFITLLLIILKPLDNYIKNRGTKTKIISENDNIKTKKQFSKSLEVLRKLSKYGYVGFLFIILIFLIYPGKFVYLTWSQTIHLIICYLILEIIKKISMKHYKDLDNLFFFGIFILIINISIVIYYFNGGILNNSSFINWGRFVESSVRAIFAGTVISSILIIILIVIEKIIKIFFLGKKVSTFNQNDNSNYSPASIQKVENENVTKSEPELDRSEIDSEIYDRIANELENDVKQMGLWTRAIADADGNESKIKSIYIKLRFEELKKQRIEFEKLRESK